MHPQERCFKPKGEATTASAVARLQVPSAAAAAGVFYARSALPTHSNGASASLARDTPAYPVPLWRGALRRVAAYQAAA